jgi:hypothetical protein
VLAIDATETVIHAMDGVARAFRHELGGRVRALGFAAVWVVGPEPGSVQRIDVDETAA